MHRAFAASLGIALVALALGGCATQLDTRVRSRAALDFSCAPRNLRIVDRTDTIYRVAGCGSIATYECSETSALAIHCDRVVWDDPQNREVTTAGGKYTIRQR